MEEQRSLKNDDNLEEASFNYRSLRQTIKLLDCSKFYLYKLINTKVIHPYYFEFDKEGKPKGKPYFNIIEIMNNFSTPSK